MLPENIFQDKDELIIKKPELLVHACCGICFENFFRFFGNSFNITVYWFNPNIHGLKEFRRRREVLKSIVNKRNLKSEYDNFYNVNEFIDKIKDSKVRCTSCYDWRLEKTSEFAEKGQFDAFTTTMLSSPNQNNSYIEETGRRLSERTGIEFFSYDMRNLYDSNILKERGLYSQGYCGCIFSEEERYK